MLAREGASALTHREVAKAAGTAVGAPSYHYPGIERLVDSAQATLYERAKDRYRDVMLKANYGALDADTLADFTATVFIREVSEYATLNLAYFSVGLDAARRAGLREHSPGRDAGPMARMEQAVGASR